MRKPIEDIRSVYITAFREVQPVILHYRATHVKKENPSMVKTASRMEQVRCISHKILIVGKQVERNFSLLPTLSVEYDFL